MKTQMDLDLNMLNLDWASKIMGAHLKIESLIKETLRYLKKSLPLKKVKFFLWDETKKRFSLEIDPDIKEVSRRPRIRGDFLSRAAELKEPLFLKPYQVLIPLRSQEKFLGALLANSPGPRVDLSKIKEEVLFLVKMAGVVIANAQVLIKSEMRNQDLFRFNVLSRALNPTVEEETIARILAEGLEGVMKFDICAFIILKKQNHRLYIKARCPLGNKTIQIVKKNLSEVISNLTKNPLDIKRIDERRDIPQGKESNPRIKSSLDAPFITKDKIIGMISLGSFKKDSFSARDQQNISILASQGAVAFENALLYQDLRRTYFSIVSALTSAIEAKDPYTRGHSVLVSQYASAIASEMGFSSSMIESIQIAGLLHDLGKIGVPEEILLKNSKLSYGEYEVVKSHPEIALKILGSVEFPHFGKEEKTGEVVPELTLRLFETADLSADVRLMIYHHHEKYAGGGYPKGIKKDEIPLGARIMAVADTFEALTADRPYRKAFPLKEAKKILKEVSGEQLDPQMVEVFLKVLRKKRLKALKQEAGV